MNGVEKEGMKLYGNMAAFTSQQSKSLGLTLEDACDLIWFNF